MSRQGREFWAVLLSMLTLLSGCAPSRTFYFFEDGDLSHYKGMATSLEYPDVEGATLAEVSMAGAPPTIRNLEDYQMWDLCLQEAIETALTNSKVIRLLTGGVNGAPDSLLRAPQSAEQAPTIYDPAIQQSNPGVGARQGGGVESALSAFDAQLSSSMFWEHNEAPQNIRPLDQFQAFFNRDRLADSGTFQAQLSKQTASGAAFAVRNNTIYDSNNSPNREVPSDYTTTFEVEARQPILQGAGTLFNRIAGPGLGPGNYNGVMIARVNTDITLADFEAQVLNQVKQVEDQYWEVYFAYRAFDAARIGRDAVLRAWRRVEALRKVGAQGGGALDEARSRAEYYVFRSAVEDRLQRLYAAENRLRYLMGLAASDGRLIRPCDEPTTAKIDFDWCEVHGESLARLVNLRRQKWVVKRVEMELIAARNFLLPRLDGVARYRWLGLGDDLLDPNGRGILPLDQVPSTSPRIRGTDAFSTLTDGNYQEWELGFQFNMPIGFRRELAGVRNAQLRLARERAVLQDQELEVSHLLTEAIRNLHFTHQIAETTFNRRIAAQREVDAAQAVFDTGAELQQGGASALDRLLDAQRRQAEADQAYFQSLANYARSITDVHFRKGSLLEYNNVLLAEGPWPHKAYRDAIERARERDAGLFINYGTTRPSVISRGPVDQFGGGSVGFDSQNVPTPAVEEVPPGETGDMADPNGQPPVPGPAPVPSVREPQRNEEYGPRLGAAEPAQPPDGSLQLQPASFGPR